MDIRALALPGLLLVTPKRIGDERGYFSETFRQDLFEAVAGPVRFVQDNHSYTRRKGTIRGLHYQAPPHAQGKLVRVTRGAVLDVAVDIRRGSASFGQWLGVELSAENGQQLWLPAGFLHGFCALSDDVEMIYKVTDYYHGPSDAAVAWNDPDLAVIWPEHADASLLSNKDRAAPRLAEAPSPFILGENC